MPFCPSCKENFKSRKQGACPKCGQELDVYDGVYYRSEIGNPVAAFFDHFEQLVSAQVSAMQGINVPFHISKKTNAWKREQSLAQTLIASCDYDIDLAMATLNVLFRNKQFSFKTRASLMHCSRDFPLAKAIAATTMAVIEKKNTQANEAFQKIEQQEDIWS